MLLFLPLQYLEHLARNRFTLSRHFSKRRTGKPQPLKPCFTLSDKQSADVASQTARTDTEHESIRRTEEGGLRKHTQDFPSYLHSTASLTLCPYPEDPYHCVTARCQCGALRLPHQAPCHAKAGHEDTEWSQGCEGAGSNSSAPTTKRAGPRAARGLASALLDC